MTTMKQKEKPEQKLRVTRVIDTLQVSEPKVDKQVSPGLNNQGEELIQREEVENTPFVMITINNETFGTFGKYRITEMYHTKQQCAVELKKIDWNRLVQITSLLIEMINETSKNK